MQQQTCKCPTSATTNFATSAEVVARRTLVRRGKHGRAMRRGASAVEFALIAPIFFLLIFGMIEYGRMIMVQQMITNASREGARTAVLDGTSIDDVKDVVVAYLEASAVPVDREKITVTPDPATSGFGQPITVSIDVPYEDISWLPGAIYLNGSTLSATSVMRRESIR